MATATISTKSSNIGVNLLSLLIFALFCAVCAYWVIKNTSLPKVEIKDAAVDMNTTPTLTGQWLRLFGTEQQTTVPMPTVVLQGVISTGYQGRAIVTIDGGKSKIIDVGDAIAPNISVTSIGNRQINFQNNGQNVVVNMPKKETNKPGSMMGASALVPDRAHGGVITNIGEDGQPMNSANSSATSINSNNQNTGAGSTNPSPSYSVPPALANPSVVPGQQAQEGVPPPATGQTPAPAPASGNIMY